MDKTINAQANETSAATPFWAELVERIERDVNVEALGLRSFICEYDIVTDLDYIWED